MSTRAKFKLYGGLGFALLDLLVQTMNPPPPLLQLALGVASAIFFLLAILDWIGQFQYSLVEKRETHELALKVSFSLLFIATMTLSLFLYHRIVSPKPDEELQEMQATIARYRRALGTDPSSGTPNLLELTNKELKQKGVLLIQKIR